MVFTVGAVGAQEPPGGAARSWHDLSRADMAEEDEEIAAMYLGGALQVRDEQAMADHLLASCCAAAREDPGRDEHRAAAAPVAGSQAAAAPAPVKENLAAAAPAPVQKRRVAAAAAPAEIAATQPPPPKVKFDSAAACSCFALPFGQGCPEQPLAVELNHAGGGGIKTYGVSRQVPLHTGNVILPSCGVVSDAAENLLAARDYVGPGGGFAAWPNGYESLLSSLAADAEPNAEISSAVA